MDPCPVLVGRQQELSTLRALLDAGGGVALISGEAGIGKSRLVREFANEAVSRGRLDLWARPEEVAQPGPYALIVDLLETIAEQGGSLKTEARALVNELTRPDTDGQRPVPAPRTVAAEIRGLVSQLGASPLIVLEDLHWADEQSHSVVLHLMRAARDDQHVVIATLRPERGRSEESLAKLKDSLARERVVTEIPLEPLSNNEITEMLECIWRRPPTDSERKDFVRLGEGIPFFIEELATSSLGTGSSSLPRTIEQSVAARVAMLGETVTKVLRAASLMSGPLDSAVLAEALDLNPDDVAAALTEAAHAGLLVDHEARLTFRHALARQAIASASVSIEIVQMHARLAKAIEKLHGDDLDPFVGALAQHYLAAGEKRSALDYTVRTGDRALAFAALEEARAAYKSAIALDPGLVAAQRGLAEVEFREGNESEAAVLFRSVADDLRKQGHPVGAARALGRLAWAMQDTAPVDSVVATLDEGLELLKTENAPSESARLVVQKGSVICFLQKDPGRARPILVKALEQAEIAGDSSLAAEALDALAQVADQEGEIAQALELGERAIKVSLTSGAAEVIGRSSHNHAVRLAAFGRCAEALQVLAEGRRHLVRAYGRAAVSALDVSEGWVAWLMGRPEQVAHLTARGRNAWQRWRGYRWLLEAWASIERADRAGAEAVIAELNLEPQLEANAAADEFQQDMAFATFARVLLLLAEPKPRPELDALTSQLIGYETAVERFDFGQMLLLRARALIALSQADRVTDLIGAAEKLAEHYHYPYLRALALEIRAEQLLQEGLPDKAHDEFALAAGAFEEIDNISDRARCLRRQATVAFLLASDPKDKDALVPLRKAWELARSVGASREGATAEAGLRAAGVRPRAGRPRRSDDSKLSPREAEVAALVAAGETNASIGARLFLSDRTVQDHIGHALRKLGLPGRAALASWAVREGMV